MAAVWHGSIYVDDSTTLQGLSFSAVNEKQQACIPLGASLRFLSVVETSRIPLHIVHGRQCLATTSSDHTKNWFSAILLGQDSNEEHAWWQTARTDSPLGVLVGVDYPKSEHDGLRATEMLLYAAKECLGTTAPLYSSNDAHRGVQVSTRLRLFALPLCSDLLTQVSDPAITPPQSPSHKSAEVEAIFLPAHPTPVTKPGVIINRPPVKKRKSVGETFDEAAERRRRAKRKGGEGVSAAAASKAEASLSDFRHRRSTSNAHIPLQNRPLSRASSVTSAKPGAVHELSIPASARTSALTQLQTVSAASSPTKITTENKNKELISKVVMAGMRLYGLHQSKSRKSRADPTAASTAVDIRFSELEAEKRNDEEFKLIYHQVYRGTCFALRQHVSTLALQMHTNAVRDTVDRLLAVFCVDPLTASADDADEDFTPGGRKIFCSSAVPDSARGNPFLQAAAAGPSNQSNTPCQRKPSSAALEGG